MHYVSLCVCAFVRAVCALCEGCVCALCEGCVVCALCEGCAFFESVYAFVRVSVKYLCALCEGCVCAKPLSLIIHLICDGNLVCTGLPLSFFVHSGNLDVFCLSTSQLSLMQLKQHRLCFYLCCQGGKKAVQIMWLSFLCVEGGGGGASLSHTHFETSKIWVGGCG